MLEKMLALQNKRKKEGGFTLVELIVVLVILAILAALLIPALTGYIDKAKDKNVIAETRQIVMAAQTILDEEYAKNSMDTDNLKISAVQTLSEVKMDSGDEIHYNNKGHITYVKHKATNGKGAWYTPDGGYTTTKQNNSDTTKFNQDISKAGT